MKRGQSKAQQQYIQEETMSKTGDTVQVRANPPGRGKWTALNPAAQAREGKREPHQQTSICSNRTSAIVTKRSLIETLFVKLLWNNMHCEKSYANKSESDY